MSHELLRIIDANLNRCSEGLRVLEDVARFALNCVELSGQLKTLRHEVSRQAKSLGIDRLSDRNSEHDVGHPRLTEKEGDDNTNRPQGLLDLVAANAKRVEESLRVLEELAKLPGMSPKLDSRGFETARFTLYSLERDLTSRLSRRDKVGRLTGVYAILDRQSLAGRDELAVAHQIIEGGARAIQLRDKQAGKRELLSVAEKVGEVCKRAGVLFIVNDHLDVALAVDADGLHIGQDDLPLPLVRRELPIDRIVGCSVTTVSQAVKAQNEGADYIAVGSVFPTATKRGATVVGVNMVREIKLAVSVPLVAVGGINRSNVRQVVAAGANAVAVISAVLGEKDVKKAVQELTAEIELARKECQS